MKKPASVLQEEKDRCELATVVPLSEVPDPPVANRSGRWSSVYCKVAELKPGTALRIPCPNQKDLLYGRGQLRLLAKKQGRILSSSRNVNHTMLYAWLEPKKEVAK